MLILAIDPGNERSALVTYDTSRKVPVAWEIVPNDIARRHVENCAASHLIVEMIASYGMPVGRTVFETCVWIGRFLETFEASHPSGETHLLYRSQVKTHLCHNSRAKDTNIRRALLDLFPRTGGGKTPEIGTKRQPGPLYGFRKDEWSALAVAITWAALAVARTWADTKAGGETT